jgi:phage terminase large subunit-like protein
MDRAKRDRQPYDVWVKQGYMHTTAGKTVDYENVAQDIVAIMSNLNIQAIAYDRWRMDILKKEFANLQVELPLQEWGQGFKDMSPAIDALEAELLNGRIAHNNHPVLTMCAANAIIQKDAAGNRKLDKSKANGRIDGLVAMAMAFGVAFNSEMSDAEAFNDYIMKPIGV